MSHSEAVKSAERGWNGAWYSVKTASCDMRFLIGADEALDAVCNLDAEVHLADGSRWSATIFTLAEVERLMKRWSASGEALGGRYFWCSDGLIIRDPGVESMVRVLADLLDCGEYAQALQRLDDEPPAPTPATAGP